MHCVVHEIFLVFLGDILSLFFFLLFFFALAASTQGHNIVVSMEADLFRGLTPERKSASGFLH